MATFRYRLSGAPEARVDGSGGVSHDIFALYSEDGATWFVVPSHHKTIVVPGDELQIVMDMPHSTGPQKQDKTTAYKVLLVEYRNADPVAYVWPNTSDWSLAGLAAYLAAYVPALEEFNVINGAAAAAAGEADSYITVALNQDYPVEFGL